MIPGVQRSQISFSFLQTYFAILLKHTRLILLLVAFSIEVAIFYYMFARPIYHVRALIEVKLLSKPTDDNVDYTQQEMYYTLQQQLQSDHILERTARRLGLHGHYEYIRRKYCKAIIVKTTSDNNMEVDIFAYSGELAQKWPRALYEAFEEYRQEKRAERREHQIKSWLYDRYKVENKLSELELKRKDLAEEMKEWEIKVGFVALKEVPKELVATRETLSQFEEIYQKLQDPNLDIDSRLALLERAQTEATVAIGEIVPGVQMKSKVEIYPQEGSSVILLPEMLNRPAENWIQLRTELRHLEEQLNQQLKIYRPAHPEIVTLKQKLTEVKGKYEREILTMQNRFFAELNHLKERRKNLEEKLLKLKELELEWESYNQRLQRIKLDMAPWEITLQKLNKALNEYDINEDRQLFFLSPPQILIASDRPEVPDPFKTIVLMIALSLFLGLGVPLLIEYLDNTITDMKEAEKILGIRSLGIIPRVEVPPLTERIEKGKPPRIIQETFRMVRTNLITQAEFGEKRQVIMVTSTLPREGKSMFSFHLTESFAMLGEKSLLIDLDLRRGRLNTIMNIPSHPGLSDYLDGSYEVTPLQLCQTTHHELLYFIPCGSRVENVPELIASPKFADLLRKLRGQFTRIVLDTPPILGLAETTGLIPLVDGCVLVIWSGYTPVEQVEVAVQQIRENGGRFFGFVLNQLDLKNPTNYYRYYYFSDYYYTTYNKMPEPT